MSYLPSFRKIPPGEQLISLPPAVPDCCWPFHGDVYAAKLGKGEAVFPEGEEDEEVSPHGGRCSADALPSPLFQSPSTDIGDVTVHISTGVPLHPFSLPYHYRNHCESSSKFTSCPSTQTGDRGFTGEGPGTFPFASSCDPASDHSETRRKARMKAHEVAHLFCSQARFTTSNGEAVTLHENRVSNELWRFRRRGFQDCWMAVFFVFFLLIALFACVEEVRSLSLTPAMRQRMEEKWGVCEFDFAGLHVRNNLQRYSDGDTTGSMHPSIVSSSSGRDRGDGEENATEKQVIFNTSGKEDAVQERSRKGVRKTKSSRFSSYDSSINESSTRFYRKIGETVTFRSMEALIVGLDYAVCNRVSGGTTATTRKKRKSTSSSVDEEEPIIDDLIDQSPRQARADDGAIENNSTTVTAEEGGSAISTADASNWLWADLGLTDSGVPLSAVQNGKEKRFMSSRSSGGGANQQSFATVDQGHRSVQKLLDTYPQTWPIYAMEWKPLLIFEVALLSASPLAICVLFLLMRCHTHVLPTLLHSALILCVCASFWCIYAYRNLIVALSLLVLGGASSWWWWLYGSSRNALTGVLLRFTGTLFPYPKCHFFCKRKVPSPSQSLREESPWKTEGETERNVMDDLHVDTPLSFVPSFPPHCTRFFLFSLTASLIHVSNFTLVSLALLPPFFHLFADEDVFGMRDALYVLLIVVSDYWLLRVIEVVLEYVSCGTVMMLYYNGCEEPPPRTPLKEFLFASLTSHLGAVCTHALLLPPVEVVYLIWSFLASSSNGEDEESRSALGTMIDRIRFFLEKKCCQHVNSFALLHVILYGCSYDDAAQYTWWLMRQPRPHLHPPHEEGEANSITGTVLPGEGKMSPSFEPPSPAFTSHHPSSGLSHPGYPSFHSSWSRPSPAVIATLQDVSEDVHQHILNSTINLTVDLIVWIFAAVVALATWLGLHLYLACLRMSSSSVASPLLSAYSSATSELQSQIKSTVESSIPRSKPGVDFSSISIAVVVFVSVSTMLHYYVLVFRAVWLTFTLCSLENPFGMACSFPSLVKEIFQAVNSFRIQASVSQMEVEREEKREEGTKMVKNEPSCEDAFTHPNSQMLPSKGLLGSGYGSTHACDNPNNTS